MTDREKVVNDLNVSKLILCNPQMLTPEMCIRIGQAITSALELLKEHEPRVLTLEEVLGGDECWFEYINGYCGHVNAYMEDNKTTIIYRTNIRPVEVLITDYMKKWRCWSDRPTDEQRKAVKWDEYKKR